MKDVLLKILNGIAIAVIVLSLLLLITVVMTGSGKAPNFLGYSVFRVMTGSMEPEIPTGAMIVTHRVDAEDIAVGDVITFYSRDPKLNGSPNTHRVVAVEQDGGALVFRTMGDANHVEDEYPTHAGDVIGVVVFSSLFLGKAVRLLSNPLIFFPLLIVPLAILLGVNLFSTVRTAKRLAKEEEEALIREILEKKRQKDEAAKMSAAEAAPEELEEPAEPEKPEEPQE